MTAQSKPVKTFPATTTEGVGAYQPVIVEIHDNGYAYIRPVEVFDIPGYNENNAR